MSEELNIEEQMAQVLSNYAVEFGHDELWETSDGKQSRIAADTILDTLHNGIPVRDYLKIPPEVVRQRDAAVQTLLIVLIRLGVVEDETGGTGPEILAAAETWLAADDPPDVCPVCRVPIDEHPDPRGINKSKSQKASIDHCGAHDTFQRWCKYCQAVQEGKLENDNPEHWASGG